MLLLVVFFFSSGVQAADTFDLTENDVVNYSAALEFDNLSEAKEFYKGSFTVVNDSTPEAEVTILPSEYLWGVGDNESKHCIKTLVIDTSNCEKVDGSMVKGPDFHRRSSQEAGLKHGERENVFSSPGTTITRCTVEQEQPGSETSPREYQIVVPTTTYTRLATKTATQCSQKAKENCQQLDDCSWDSATSSCDYDNLLGLSSESEVKFWFLRLDRCRMYGKDFDREKRTRTYKIRNDFMYRSLIGHYMIDSGDSTEKYNDSRQNVLYHIKHFFDSQYVYTNFFEKYATLNIKNNPGAVPFAERVYCYRTGFRDTPWCFDTMYPVYSLTSRFSSYYLNRSYPPATYTWNTIQYIRERPHEDAMTGTRGVLEEPAGATAGGSIENAEPDTPPDKTPAWEEVWAYFYGFSPLLRVPVEGFWPDKWWTRTGNVNFFEGSGFLRRDSCDYSCFSGSLLSDAPNCNLLRECGIYDPMDADLERMTECLTSWPRCIKLCQDTQLDGGGYTPPSVGPVGNDFPPCNILRGHDDECESGTMLFDFAIGPVRINAKPMLGDCWGTKDQDEECKVISQYMLMKDDPPLQCAIADAGRFIEFGINGPIIGGFERKKVPFYLREWGGHTFLMACDECDDGAEEDMIDEKDDKAPGPDFKTKWVLNGGMKATTKITFHPDSAEFKGLSPVGGAIPQALDLDQIAPNIWKLEFDDKSKKGKGRITMIETGNQPFEITCAYVRRVGPIFYITRYYKTSKFKEFQVDTDMDFEYNHKQRRVFIDATHEYRTGIREDRFYHACDRFLQNCDDICDWCDPMISFPLCQANELFAIWTFTPAT